MSLINITHLMFVLQLLSCVHCGTLASSEEMSTNDDEKIIFPGQMPIQLSSRLKSTCVENFCNDLTDYPVEYINKIINNSVNFGEFFVEDTPTVAVNTRGQFDASDENTMCESTILAMYPRIATNTNNTQRIIVNTEEFKQLVMTEVCNPNAKCKFIENFPNNYEASCKQKFMRKRLVSVKENKTFIDLYDVPCCCVCSIKKKN